MIIILWGVIPHWMLVAWYSAVLLVTIPKYLLVRKFWDSSQSPESADRWGNRIIIGAALSGTVWGSAGVFIFPAHSTAHQFFIVLMIGGMVAGASGTYSAIMRVFSAYSLPAIVPVAIRFFLFADEIHIAIGGIILLFEFLMFVNAKRVNAAIVSSLKLRFENRDLVGSLAVEKKRLEILNTEYADEIVQRKQTEEQLKQKNEQLEFVMKGANIGWWDWDLPSGNTIYNKIVSVLLGYEVNETTPHINWWEDKIHPDDLKQVENVLQEHFDKNTEYYVNEHRLITKQGEWKWFLGHGKVIERDKDGKPIRMIGTLRDITEGKQAEEELQKMQKLKSIGTLAGGIAHDFNNILMGLFGNISLAKMKLSKDHPGFKSLEKAEKSMNRATRLTRQLLTFAKGGEPVKEDVHLGEFVEKVTRFHLSGSNVTLVSEQAEDLWMTEVDKGQVQQVFSNLTINANEAMRDGGHLYITLENADISEDAVPNLNPGKYVKVTVRDEGTGIEQKHLDRIFDPYFSTKQAGSGIGLATVYSIINKHSGHISVDSALGKGTTFTLYLPASESQQQPETKQPEAEPSTKEQTARILVMDDEKMVLEVVTSMLESTGYSVETADGGKQALEMYKQSMDAGEPFDVVIMDLTIPDGVGGKEAIKDILEIDPEARCIVSSGYADDPVMASYAEYGFKGIAPKPYTMSELREVLSQVLEK
jgi:PAS domain S-box-containing protein